MSSEITNYLLDLKYGRIKTGLKINCYLDDHLVFKKKQLSIILGHDNVGKSYFIFWYFLNLALQHNIKFCMYAGENGTNQIMRDLLRMYTGKRIEDLTDREVVEYTEHLCTYFKFIDNRKSYKAQDLFDIFEASQCDVGLIDPFTALDRDMSYTGNYLFLNHCREFINQTGMTIYLSTHPNTEAGRMSNLYQQNHDWAGHLRPPLKDSVEGGKAFLNRCDDMFVIHRLIKHETMKFYTMISVEKIKDIETGGKHTYLDQPILCEFNNGFGFKLFGSDPLQNYRPKEIRPNQFPLNY
jgi:hypothetical protein